MATVEALCQVRLGAPGSGQAADGTVMWTKPGGFAVAETISFSEIMGLWDRPNVSNQWFNNYPLLSTETGGGDEATDLVAAAQLDRAGRVAWINTYIPSDAGISTNWGIQDLRVHTVFVVDDWPEGTLPIGQLPIWNQDGTEITSVSFEYAGNIPPAIEAEIRDETLWAAPRWENENAERGWDFATYAVVTTGPPPA